MIKIGKPKPFDGAVLIELLTSNGVTVKSGSLGVPVPLINGDGDLYLDIDEKDLTKVKSLLAEYLV
jgi:hypothetical protein